MRSHFTLLRDREHAAAQALVHAQAGAQRSAAATLSALSSVCLAPCVWRWGDAGEGGELAKAPPPHTLASKVSCIRATRLEPRVSTTLTLTHPGGRGVVALRVSRLRAQKKERILKKEFVPCPVLCTERKQTSQGRGAQRKKEKNFTTKERKQRRKRNEETSGACTWSTCGVQSSTSHPGPGELRSAPSGPDDRYRVTG